MNDRPKRSAEYSTGSLDGRPIIFGEVLFDQFPDGSSVLGGAPFNVAWHLQGFGVAPLFLSCVGDDEPGRRVRHAMRDWGMDAEGLQTDPSHPTGAVNVNFAQGGHTFDILSDQSYDHIDIAFAQAVSRQIDCALLYHGTLIMRTAVTRDALQGLLADSGLPAFVDINLRDPWWRVEDLPAVFDRARWAKVNDDELKPTRVNRSAARWRCSATVRSGKWIAIGSVRIAAIVIRGLRELKGSWKII